MPLFLTRSLFFSFISFSFLLSFSPPSQAGQFGSDEIMSFADALYNEKDYYRAITEYKRIIFHFPSSEGAKKAGFKIALSYMEGKRYDAAVSELKKFRQLYRSDPLAIEALFLIAEATFRAGNYDDASRYFAMVESEAIQPGMRARAAVARGWSLARKGDWQGASDIINNLQGVDGPLEYGDMAEDLKVAGSLPLKSPSLAGTFSAIIPGSGQLYIGRKKDAAAAFLLNAAFIAGAAEAFRKDEDATGAILLFFEAGWYAGNIYSAVSGAHKYNMKTKEDSLYRLEQKYALGLDGRGHVFGMYRLRF